MTSALSARHLGLLTLASLVAFACSSTSAAPVVVNYDAGMEGGGGTGPGTGSGTGSSTGTGSGTGSATGTGSGTGSGTGTGSGSGTGSCPAMDPAETASACTAMPVGACVLTANIGHTSNMICWDFSSGSPTIFAMMEKTNCMGDTAEGATWYPGELCPSVLGTLALNTAGGCSTVVAGSAQTGCETKWYGLGTPPGCFTCNVCTIEKATTCSHP